MEPTLCCASSDILKEKKKNWCQRHPRFSVISKASRKSIYVYIYIGFYQRTGGYVICRGGGVGHLLFSILFEYRGYIRTGSLIC
jgi:hypothetical protein